MSETYNVTITKLSGRKLVKAAYADRTASEVEQLRQAARAIAKRGDVVTIAVKQAS